MSNTHSTLVNEAQCCTREIFVSSNPTKFEEMWEKSKKLGTQNKPVEFQAIIQKAF